MEVVDGPCIVRQQGLQERMRIISRRIAVIRRIPNSLRRLSHGVFLFSCSKISVVYTNCFQEPLQHVLTSVFSEGLGLAPLPAYATLLCAKGMYLCFYHQQILQSLVGASGKEPSRPTTDTSFSRQTTIIHLVPFLVSSVISLSTFSKK